MFDLNPIKFENFPLSLPLSLKVQTIDMYKEGIGREILDKFQPDILIYKK